MRCIHIFWQPDYYWPSNQKRASPANLLLAYCPHRTHGAYNPVVPLASTRYLNPDDKHDGHLEVERSTPL